MVFALLLRLFERSSPGFAARNFSGLVQPRRQWWWRGGLYLNTLRAFCRVNRQLILVRLWSARWFQALVSCRNFFRSGIRRLPRHCRAYRLSSISACLSQLPCFGVYAR